MKTINRIANGYAKFARWVAVISGVVVVLLMVYTTADVTGRYLFNRPVPAAYEMTVIFLIYVTYFGITLVQARGGHMRLGFLYEKASPRGKALIDFFTVLVGLFIFAIVTWQGWKYAIESWTINEVTMGAYTVPVFPGRIGLAIGASVFVIQYIIDLIKNIGLIIAPGQTGALLETSETNTGEAGAKL